MIILRDPRWLKQSAQMQLKLRKVGLDFDLKHIDRLWDAYSDSLCAGWLDMEPYSASSFLEVVNPFLLEAFNDDSVQ